MNQAGGGLANGGGGGWSGGGLANGGGRGGSGWASGGRTVRVKLTSVWAGGREGGGE